MPAAKTDLVKRMIRFRKEREAAEAKAAKAKAQMDALEPSVLEWFQQQGIGSIKVDGVTVHIRRELWASVGDQGLDFLRDALDVAGIDSTTIISERANTQTLSALVREFDKAGNPLPNSLAAAVNVSEKFKLGFRAS
ncbi:MAG: hypothetical protein U1E60_32185 [Reyranellaceae bacterium]